jgi:hypothetical protein
MAHRALMAHIPPIRLSGDSGAKALKRSTAATNIKLRDESMQAQTGVECQLREGSVGDSNWIKSMLRRDAESWPACSHFGPSSARARQACGLPIRVLRSIEGSALGFGSDIIDILPAP